VPIGSKSSGTNRPQNSLDIGKILNPRLSVLILASSGWWFEDLADMEAKNRDAISKALKAAPQLTDVRLLPSPHARRDLNQNKAAVGCLSKE